MALILEDWSRSHCLAEVGPGHGRCPFATVKHHRALKKKSLKLSEGL